MFSQILNPKKKQKWQLPNCYLSFPRAIIGQRGSLSVTPLGYLNFKKVIFRTMRTMRKQFPVNWLTSGRFSAPKRGGGSVNEKNGCLKWRDDVEGVYLINCPSSSKNLPLKLVKTSTQTDPLQETVETQLKRPRGPSFLLEQLERGQVALRPG